MKRSLRLWLAIVCGVAFERVALAEPCDDLVGIDRAGCLVTKQPQVGPNALGKYLDALDLIEGDPTPRARCLAGRAYLDLQRLNEAGAGLKACPFAGNTEDIESTRLLLPSFQMRIDEAQAAWPHLVVHYPASIAGLVVRPAGGQKTLALPIPVVKKPAPAKGEVTLTLEKGSWEISANETFRPIRLKLEADASLHYSVLTFEVDAVPDVMIVVRRDEDSTAPLRAGSRLFVEPGTYEIDARYPGLAMPVTRVIKITDASAEVLVPLHRPPVDPGPKPPPPTERAFSAFARGDQVVDENARAGAVGGSLALAPWVELRPAFLYASRFMGADLGAALWWRATDAVSLGLGGSALLLARHDGVGSGNDRTLTGIRPSLMARVMVASPVSFFTTLGADLYPGADVYRGATVLASLGVECQLWSSK